MLDPEVLSACIGVCEDMLDLARCFALHDEHAIEPLLEAGTAEALPFERQSYAAGLAAELTVKLGLDPQPVRKVLWKLEHASRAPEAQLLLAQSLRLLDEGQDPEQAPVPLWSAFQLSDLLPEHRPRTIVGSTYTVRRPVAKLGRNDPCHCGSGKKYKKCCYAKDQELLRDASQYAGTTRTDLKAKPGMVDDPNVVLDMRAHELKQLAPAALNEGQLHSGYHRALAFGWISPRPASPTNSPRATLPWRSPLPARRSPVTPTGASTTRCCSTSSATPGSTSTWRRMAIRRRRCSTGSRIAAGARRRHGRRTKRSHGLPISWTQRLRPWTRRNGCCGRPRKRSGRSARSWRRRAALPRQIRTRPMRQRPSVPRTGARLRRLRGQVEGLKAEIGAQQAERRQLRKLLGDERKKLAALSESGASAEKPGATEEAAVVKPAGRPILPEYSDAFRKRLGSLAPPLAAKVILAAARFASQHEAAIWRHTKPLERLPEHYRIRLGIDYRLMVHWQPGKVLKIVDVIPRQDLESWIRRQG